MSSCTGTPCNDYIPYSDIDTAYNGTTVDDIYYNDTIVVDMSDNGTTVDDMYYNDTT